jgi:hypothetical protein
MAPKEFRSKLEDNFIALPFDVRKLFGRARPPVKVSINGFSYRSTVSVYDGKYFIPVRKSNQEAARIKPGDTVRAIIELDEEPRTVDPPLDLMTALKQSHLEADWDKLSYSTKKEFADVLQAAKRPETRARRVEKILLEIRERKK